MKWSCALVRECASCCAGRRLSIGFGIQDIAGLKYFCKLEPLLAGLHEGGARRGRQSRYVHRSVWHADSDFGCSVRWSTACGACSRLVSWTRSAGSLAWASSLGSLSESVTIFDPEPLKQIAAELSAADRAAGVLGDEVVLLGQSKEADARPDHPVWLVTVAATPHTSHGSSTS